MSRFFDRLRTLQNFIREQGLGGSLLALPAPTLLMLPDASPAENKEELLFIEVVTEDEIASVSRDLFESGHFTVAVSEAFKALDTYIKEKVGDHELSGTKLMQEVFSVGDPRLTWSKRKTTSEKDEHRGYSLMFMGSFTGIRNPASHEIDWINDHREALDAILIAQHLLRKAKAARPKGSFEIAGV